VFISSFCTHEATLVDEDAQGLLNQWRAYSGNGGVALVFTADFIKEMLDDEVRHFSVGARLSKVRYDIGQAIVEQYPALVNNANALLHMSIIGEAGSLPYFDIQEQFFDDFVEAITTFKHGAFREERESRIVVITYEPAPGMKSTNRATKNIKARTGKRGTYISLNVNGTPLGSSPRDHWPRVRTKQFRTPNASSCRR
jgi:hypothetical protein